MGSAVKAAVPAGQLLCRWVPLAFNYLMVAQQPFPCSTLLCLGIPFEDYCIIRYSSFSRLQCYYNQQTASKLSVNNLCGPGKALPQHRERQQDRKRNSPEDIELTQEHTCHWSFEDLMGHFCGHLMTRGTGCSEFPTVSGKAVAS